MKIMKSLILVFVISLVLLVSCNQNKPAAPSPTAHPEQAAPAPAPAPATKDDAVSSDFKNLLSKKTSLEWQATYDVVSKVEGTTTKSTMIQYIKGLAKLRIDTSTQGFDARTYIVNNVATSCSKTENKWTCFKLNKPESQAPDFEKEYQADPLKYKIVSDGTKTAAGLTGKCFKVTATGIDGSTRECIADNGMLVYMLSEYPTFTTEMTILLYGTAVAESVFVPPAEAKDMSSITMPAAAPSGSNCAACDYLSGDMKTQCLKSC